MNQPKNIRRLLCFKKQDTAHICKSKTYKHCVKRHASEEQQYCTTTVHAFLICLVALTASSFFCIFPGGGPLGLPLLGRFNGRLKSEPLLPLPPSLLPSTPAPPPLLSVFSSAAPASRLAAACSQHYYSHRRYPLRFSPSSAPSPYIISGRK